MKDVTEIANEITSPDFWATLGNGWDWYWMWTKAVAIPGGFLIMFCITIYILAISLRFNYHYYIKHGEFVLYLDAGDHRNNSIKDIVKQYKIGVDNDLLPWFQALIAIGIQAGLIFILSLVWPIASITILPLALVRLIAYRTRKKTLFLQKLEGTADD